MTENGGVSKETKRIIKLAEEIREQNRRFKREQDDKKLGNSPNKSGLPKFGKHKDEKEETQKKSTNYKY